MPASLSYTTTGNPRRPALLFLHGFMGSRADWQPIMQAVSADASCIAVDLPGHGHSLGLDTDAYSMSGTSDALIEVLDELGISSCTVVGYSMGGRVALYFAVHHPERCTGLILESASPGLRTETERTERRHLDAERTHALSTDFDAFLDSWYRMPLFETLHRFPDRFRPMLTRRRQNIPDELARALNGLSTGRQPSLWPDLPNLNLPVGLITGTLDAKYTTLAAEMANALPNTQTAYIPNAGHNTHLEQPELYIQALNHLTPSPAARVLPLDKGEVSRR